MAVTEMHGLKTRLVVGMEVHVELATLSKMWTSAPNVAHASRYDAEPNTLLDPVVIGMPGTLPVMNERAVEYSIRVGLALGCEIARWCKWDRKSYYYPDLPKNYQISQYDLPLCGPGVLECPVSDDADAEVKPIRILRAHLEEDAGKLAHEAPGGRPIDYSIVDLNRAGTPLLEIVTEPDVESADQAVAFCHALRNICRFLGVSECIMQKGQIRFEPNINVHIERDAQTYKTPIAEIKNLNSFRAVHGSIEYEHERQVRQWLDDGKVMGAGAKSTLGWDDAKMETTHQRDKEDAHDYRYFPDPDLVPLTVSEDWLEEIRATVPELPQARKQRYVEELGLNAKDAAAIIDEPKDCEFFEAVLKEGADPRGATNLIRNSLAQYANDAGKLPSEWGIKPAELAQVERLRREDKINSSGAHKLIGQLGLVESDEFEDVTALAEKNGLLQVSDDSALDAWVDAAIEAEPAAADDVRSGKMAAIGRLVGVVMKLSKGQANPKAVQAKLREKLS